MSHSCTQLTGQWATRVHSCCSVVTGQSVPPLAALRRTALDLVFTPVPQSAEQAPQSLQAATTQSDGQAKTLQLTVWVSAPQGFPPYAAAFLTVLA